MMITTRTPFWLAIAAMLLAASMSAHAAPETPPGMLTTDQTEERLAGIEEILVTSSRPMVPGSASVDVESILEMAVDAEDAPEPLASPTHESSQIEDSEGTLPRAERP